ncbi:hypothetical protein [Nonomuraea aridisoli]|uniref:DUF732 domain-containing protein n=1 Tax=Nonomuraea aridisoli TaxID=2070368 RepID=A0A2W2FIS7_9ACTN|nr:hypothetical protein [Nonomuraea aridisoli]PZG21637.1 hypothetical protein C1J01_06260 [Nonomuraea aridisoli]
MFKTGLILAGVVGGLVLTGGSALANDWPQGHDDADKAFFVCGDENVFGREVENNTNGLINVDTDELLSGLLLGTAADTVECSSR